MFRNFYLLKNHKIAMNLTTIKARENEWEAINCKQITRGQHVSQLKASSFSSWQQKSLLLKTQQLILGTGTAIWWLTEPHLESLKF
jgi:hypothetical protein